MVTRTLTRSVRFARRFWLNGLESEQPPGVYTVETDEVRVEGLSFDAYRRIATTIRLPTSSGSPHLDRIVLIDPVELATALDNDRQEHFSQQVKNYDEK